MRRTVVALLSSSIVLLAGCHSHYIQATVTNHSDAEVSVVQVEYPGATFGTQSIAPGGSFYYRFKLLGSGDLKVSWIDAQKHDHAVKSLHLNEGQEGTLVVDFSSQTSVTVTPGLRP